MAASFLDPMLLGPCTELPAGADWLYELKLDGYRALGVKAGGRIRLRSRNDHDFSKPYRAVAKTLEALPQETVVDGELVAVDESRRPSFNLLQNPAAGAPVFYYVFDLLVLKGRDITGEPFSTRRRLLEEDVLPLLADPVRDRSET